MKGNKIGNEKSRAKEIEMKEKEGNGRKQMKKGKQQKTGKEKKEMKKEFNKSGT